MHRHRRAMESMSEINLTSLLDLTFVLLIAFMIVAPSLQSQVDVKIPEDVPGAMPASKDPDTIIITVAKPDEGSTLDRIYITRKGRTAERVTDIDDLVQQLIQARMRNVKTSVSVEVDDQAPAGALIRVYGACQTAGFEEIAVPTKPNDDRAP